MTAERHAPAPPSCVARPAAGADCTKISRQITDRSYVRALCDTDVIELHRRWPAEALSRAWRPLMQGGQLRRASISLCAIQSGLDTIQEVALIERLGQIADDPSLKCAGANIIARIGSYQYGGNLFARSGQVVV
jgi:hypothetical protein